MTTPPSAPRRVKLFDGFDTERNEPVVNRVKLRDGELRPVFHYLNSAFVVLFASGFGEDAFSPDSPPDVPMKYSTDGTWIWPAAVTYYLAKYEMPPEPEFLEHIRAQNYELPEVSEQAAEAARLAMTSGA